MHRFILTGMLLLLATTSVHSKIYKWTDHQGKMHFTDNLAAVPPQYRDQVEERKSTLTDAARTQQDTTTLAAPQMSAVSTQYDVPLHGDGGALFVDVLLNNTLQARLHLDTGATYTVLSHALAQQLRLNLAHADIIPLTTANGVILAAVLEIDSISVNGATVHDVDVVVHDTGGAGLLGMSFLSNFDVSLNTRERKMVLTTTASTPDTPTYDGRSEDWWRNRFAFYRRAITDIDAYLKNRQATHLERSKLASALQLYRQKLSTLERKASQAAVPRHWRY